jgi:hypothetical protein
MKLGKKRRVSSTQTRKFSNRFGKTTSSSRVAGQLEEEDAEQAPPDSPSAALRRSGSGHPEATNAAIAR